MAKKRKGFTLAELLVVITIIAIIAGVSIGIGAKQVANAKTQKTTMFLQTVVENIEESVMDMGFLPLTYTDESGFAYEKEAIMNYLDEMAAVYLICGIDRTSIMPVITAEGYVGFSVKLTMSLDAWDQPYTMFYLTNFPSLPEPKMPSDAGYFISIASIGPNAVASEAYASGYFGAEQGNGVDDDIIAIMQSR